MATNHESISQVNTPRSATICYVLAMLLALVGLFDALYLTIQHLNGKSLKCSITNGCSVVLSSSYATLAGYPTAAFGVGAYFIAFSLATLAAFGHRWARLALALWMVPMFLTSGWLVYLQGFVLHAWCQFCLLSAAMTTCITLLAWWAKFAQKR